VLTREEVVAVYREVLKRPPREDEVEAQLAGMPSLEALLRVVLDSEEYAAILRARGLSAAAVQTAVNVYHPDLAQWGLQPGTRSADGVAIVGHNGWLFLCGGTNANLDHYLGLAELPFGWQEGWREAVTRMTADAEELGIAMALLMVPDKLAVYEEQYPEELQKARPRPAERLQAIPGLPITYPLAELRAAVDEGQEIYQRTDSHLTFQGNRVLLASVLSDLEIESSPDFSEMPLRSYPVAGDLGARFDPQIVSIVSEPGSLGHARIVQDNREQIAAVDGHIGTQRIFHNEQASDPRVAVVFGDSFAFASPDTPGLSWFLSQIFQEVHFIWVPFGWDPEYVRRVKGQAVLVQGAERFASRIPRLDIDVDRLAEETLQRKSAGGGATGRLRRFHAFGRLLRRS
jgi:alginate O-acetyltransferase complex protein AlgJ